MKRAIASLSILVLISSCQLVQNKKTYRQIKVANEGLQLAHRFMFYQNETIYHNLDQKKVDPVTAASAYTWQPLVDSLRRFTSHMRALINGLQEHMEEQKTNDLSPQYNRLKHLHFQLATYFDNLRIIFSPVSYPQNEDLQRALKLEPPSSLTGLSAPSYFDDSSTSDASDWINTWFANTTPMAAITVLEKIKGDLIIIENGLLLFIDTRTNSNLICGGKPDLLTSLNSTTIKKGQPLVITAGIGSFYISGNPVFTINGQPVKLDTEGIVTWQSIADGPPGKHSALVKVEYSKPDGSRCVGQKEIKYTVVN